MKIYESYEQLENIEKGWVLSIGNFDGVHLGHQKIISTAHETAERLNAAGVAVMTFDPHPAALLRPGAKPGILTPMQMRKHLLERYGVNAMIIMTDRTDIFNLSPEKFVDDFLMKTLGPVAILEGPNFCFGYGRSGDIGTLKKLGEARGFEVIEVPPQRLYTWGEKPVMFSSTLIRNSLMRGDVHTARAVMGRPYRLVGEIVPGRGVGKTLGYPTANLKQGKQYTPAEGVYAGLVCIGDTFKDACIGDDTTPAVFSIGRAKTFESGLPLLIEAHLFEQKVPDLVGKYMAMDFIRLIRPQQVFDSREHLSKQIAVDCRQAKEVLLDEQQNK